MNNDIFIVKKLDECPWCNDYYVSVVEAVFAKEEDAIAFAASIKGWVEAWVVR